MTSTPVVFEWSIWRERVILPAMGTMSTLLISNPTDWRIWAGSLLGAIATGTAYDGVKYQKVKKEQKND